jgi:16S rRNA (guanine966-N2)-methyltransferase
VSGRSRGGAGRVIAGSARGITLQAPGEGTRPLSDRVKQALFAILEPAIRGRPFLDLFAGSGAGGIEALSRGASRALFVDRDDRAVGVIRQNLQATGLHDAQVTVARRDVGAWLAWRASSPPDSGGAFAAILVDPPYDRPTDLDEALEAIGNAGRGIVLADDGVVVAKHFWKTPPASTPLLRSVRRERFGETMLTFYHWADEEDG